MPVMNVVKSQRVIFSHPNCLWCESQLSPELQPIGFCEKCLSEDTFTLFDSERVYVIFTLRELLNWPVSKIANLIEMFDVDDIVSILMEPKNKIAFEEYKKVLLND